MVGNQYLMFSEGVVALESVDHLETYFALQRRHPDGVRWLDVAHFATREDARQIIDKTVAAGRADPSDLRVQKVTRETV
jgi:hypothetical protein